MKVTFTAQIQIFKHLMPILSREGKIGDITQCEMREETQGLNPHREQPGRQEGNTAGQIRADDTRRQKQTR